MTTPLQDRRSESAQILYSQCEAGVLMSLGAHRLHATTAADGDHGLAFTALILAYRADGTRSERVQKMTVEITHNAADTYDITVTYPQAGQLVTHESHHGIYCDALNPTLLSLDSDGDRPGR